MFSLRYRAGVKRTTVEDELNMAGLNIDFPGQRRQYKCLIP